MTNPGAISNEISPKKILLQSAFKKDSKSSTNSQSIKNEDMQKTPLNTPAKEMDEEAPKPIKAPVLAKIPEVSVNEEQKEQAIAPKIMMPVEPVVEKTAPPLEPV